MQHLQSLNLLEERIQAAVELITYLKVEKKKLEAENSRLLEQQRALERKLETTAGENEELAEANLQLIATQEEWVRFERDREDLRTRIDGMLAKFEELEV